MTVRKLAVAASALVLATALAGCGKVGKLEPASPLFGAKARAGEPAPPAQDPTRAIQTVDPRDRDAADPVPPPPAPPTPPTTRQ